MIFSINLEKFFIFNDELLFESNIMNIEEKEGETSKKRSKGKIIAFILDIIGTILLISGVIIAIRGSGMFGDFDAPWFETVSTGTGLIFGGIVMIIISIPIHSTIYQFNVMPTRKIKTLGHDAEFDRYEKMIQEKSKPQTSGTSRSEMINASESVNGEQVVKIKCQLCGALNDEDAHYCDQCAQPL